MNHLIVLVVAVASLVAAPDAAGLEILRREFWPNVVVANDIDVIRSTPGPRTSDSTDIVILGHGTFGMPPAPSSRSMR